MDTLNNLPMWTRISLIGDALPPEFVEKFEVTRSFRGAVVKLDKWASADDVENVLNHLSVDPAINCGAVVHDDEHSEVIACYRVLGHQVRAETSDDFDSTWGFRAIDFIASTKLHTV